MEKRAVLWDADGVLFHSYDAQNRFFWSMDVEADLGIPEAVAQRIFAAGWNDVLRGTKETRQHIADIMRNNGFAGREDACIDYWLVRDRLTNPALVTLLDPVNSYVATNQDPLRTKVIESVLRGRIVKVFASSALHALKPEASYYEQIEEELGLPPRQIFFIDDNAANVEAAAARGWRAHLYKTDAGVREFLGF